LHGRRVTEPRKPHILSIVGAHTGIISLGMSCQTTYQIRQHASLISSFIGTGEALREESLPFDWLICPPGSASRMLDQRVFFPDDLAGLSLNGAPFWQRFNTYFWHDFVAGPGQYELASSFEGVKGKYEHLARKFRGLSRIDRLVMVISNSQNNLEMVSERTRTIAKEMRAADIERLRSAADDFFARSCEYIVVTHDDRLDRDPCGDTIATYRIAKDSSEWRGDKEQWAGVFADYFGRWPQAKAAGIGSRPAASTLRNQETLSWTKV
jgi:hypothetical protein